MASSGNAAVDWLATEPKWRVRLGDNWKGTKVLGVDSWESVVGLFEDTVTDPIADPQSLKKIVVKQVLHEGAEFPIAGGVSPGAQAEGRIYDILREASTKRIVEMFRRVHVDWGSGCAIPADVGDEVGRLYLEFCPGGDMRGFLQKLESEYKTRGRMLAEEDVWSIFHDFALACSVLHRGTEVLRGTYLEA